MEICIESIFRDAIPYVVDTVVYTAYDAGRRFINNYDKRRDVGFTPWPSIKDSFQENHFSLQQYHLKIHILW